MGWVRMTRHRGLWETLSQRISSFQARLVLAGAAKAAKGKEAGR